MPTGIIGIPAQEQIVVIASFLDDHPAEVAESGGSDLLDNRMIGMNARHGMAAGQGDALPAGQVSGMPLGCYLGQIRSLSHG